MYLLAGEHEIAGSTAEEQTQGEPSSPHSHILSPSAIHDFFSGEDGLTSLSTDILLHVAAHAKGPDSGAL